MRSDAARIFYAIIGVVIFMTLASVAASLIGVNVLGAASAAADIVTKVAPYAVAAAAIIMVMTFASRRGLRTLGDFIIFGILVAVVIAALAWAGLGSAVQFMTTTYLQYLPALAGLGLIVLGSKIVEDRGALGVLIILAGLGLCMTVFDVAGAISAIASALTWQAVLAITVILVVIVVLAKVT